MELSITLIITIATVIVSLWGFSNQKIIDDLIFYGPAISSRRQYYRFITSGFIHADFMHLAFNLFAFYSFGRILENNFAAPAIFGRDAPIYYCMLYLGGLIVSNIPDYFKHKDNYYFRSLGASGAVSSVIFACIILFPTLPISIMFLPIGIPGWIFGLLYILLSAYLDKRGGGNINHSAHLWGAVFGIVFMLVFVTLKGEISIWQNFLYQITG